MEKTACTVCGNQVKWKGSVTCSRECSNVLKKKKTYEHRSCLECGEKFEIRKKLPNKLCSDVCRKKWNAREENKASRIEKGREAYKKKTGYGSIFEDPKRKSEISQKAKQGIDEIGKEEFSRRSKATKKERYGDENYNNHHQTKITKKKRYGDEHYNNRFQAEETMIDKYGVSHAMMLEEFQEKQRESFFMKWGHNSPMQVPSIRQKAIETNINKYGHPSPSSNNEIKEKVKDYWENLDTKQKQIVRELHKYGLELLGEFKGFQNRAGAKVRLIKYSFKCQCGNVFNGTFSSYSAPICRTCNPISKSSLPQQFVRGILLDNGVKFSEGDRHIIAPLELDFVIENQKIAIEVNGNYWHSEVGGSKDRKYHLNKTKRAFEEGYRCIHIFEDEIINKPTQVESRLKSILNLNSKKIAARKCEVRVVDLKTRRDFINQYHLQGDVVAKLALGLYYENELISVASFGKARVALGRIDKKDNLFELLRFVSKKELALESCVPIS